MEVESVGSELAPVLVEVETECSELVSPVLMDVESVGSELAPVLVEVESEGSELVDGVDEILSCFWRYNKVRSDANSKQRTVLANLSTFL